MATVEAKRQRASKTRQGAGRGYRGKQTKTGNSSGFRFEGALFRSHPEFNGEVRAHVIAPGRMLVVAEPREHEVEAKDPVLEAFLSLLASDIESHPEKIRPFTAARAKRIERLTRGIEVNLDEDLGAEALI